MFGGVVWACLLLWQCITIHSMTVPVNPNILFIIYDDLRNDLTTYGQNVTTPNFESFAKESLTFNNAYVQQAICSPSRNSFLSGRRPDTTKTWNFKTDFRKEGGENWESLPQFFKNRGWWSQGAGKLYHPGHPPKFDPPSWSDLKEFPYELHETGCPKKIKKGGGDWCELTGKQVSDSGDRQIIQRVAQLMNYSINGVKKLFWLGAGFHRPHMPWASPKEYYDMYPIGSLPIATHNQLPNGAILEFTHDNRLGAASPEWTYDTPMSMQHQQLWRRAYWASVSFADSNLGLMLDALKKSGEAEKTIVVVVGDHGWSLGEDNIWMKSTCMELSTRVPLLIRVPWITASHGKKTSALVELVDLYPTLAELAGLTVPANETIEGESFAKIFTDPNSEGKVAAYSQFPRCGTDIHNLDNCPEVLAVNFTYMGYSIRTSRWRYTEWAGWDGVTLKPVWDPVKGRELYDHQGDDGTNFNTFEFTNLADDPGHAAIVQKLSQELRAQFNH